jgi:Uma2 family endonuclease
VWDPVDVLLVVEVSSQTMLADLEIKAKLYGRAGYAVYWLMTPEVIYAHTEPTPQGYRTRTEFRPGERIPVAYADTELDVSDLLAQD